MKAKKCDICNQFYDIYGGKNGDDEQVNTLKLIGLDTEDNYLGGRFVEFCPDCKKKVYELLNIKLK